MSNVKHHISNEKGSYLVLGAFVLVALLIVAGLAVDVSRKYQLEQRAQDVADAAAQAGAQFVLNAGAAETAAISYVQQAAGSWYMPRETDVWVQTNTVLATSTSYCTVGVMVRGTWDPIIMPAWLFGDPEMQITRYAIAIGSVTGGTAAGSLTAGDLGIGDVAFFIGDTAPGGGNPSCGGSYIAQISGNNIDVTGKVQINQNLNYNGSDFVTIGQVNVAGSITGDPANVTATGGIVQGAPVVELPKIDESKLKVDVVLDINIPGAMAYYGGGADVPLKGAGTNGVFGDADDSFVYADNGAAVTAKYAGTDGFGHQLWEINGPNNRRITAAANPGFGEGVDIKVVGDLQYKALDGQEGLLWTTGALAISQNNADYNATADNPGLVLYSGEPGDPTKESLLVNSNYSQESFYGLVYANGNAKLNGNASNNTHTIVGGLWAKRLDQDCAGAINGNNWGILGDITLLRDIPILGAPAAAKISSPTVYLKH